MPRRQEARGQHVLVRIGRALGLSSRPGHRLPDELHWRAQREQVLARVHAAATAVHEDWEAGTDLDEGMRRLRAELRSAAEFEAWTSDP